MKKDYLVYGLRLRSDMVLPCVTCPADGEPDCVITTLPPLEHAQPSARDVGKLMRTNNFESVWQITEDHWRVEYHDQTSQQWLQLDFIQAGRSITILYTRDAIVANIPFLLLAGLFAPILWKAGKVCLHGAVVNSDQGGILILGDSGAGKSSTLTALLQLGCEVLTDDIAVLDPKKPCVAHCGPTYLRLWHDSAIALGIDPTTLPLVFRPEEIVGNKRYIDLKDQNAATSVQVNRIYILAGRSHIEHPIFKLLTPALAVPYLFKNRFKGLSLEESIDTQALGVCVALANQSTVYLLRTPANLASLTSIAKGILEQAIEVQQGQ